MTAPQFNYVRFPDGKATVTCTCGWRDPLGPIAPSPFDPAESLAAASGEHPRCVANGRVESDVNVAASSPGPGLITEQTTLAELAVQRALLGVTALTLMRSLEGARTAVVQSTSGLHIGNGATEAAAIDAAFASLRQAMLPTASEALNESA